MSNDLYQEAHKAYLRDNSVSTLQADFETILSSDCGYVLSSPEVFCLARCVYVIVDDNLNVVLGEEVVIDPIYGYFPEHWNCWHIHVLAGDMQKLFTWMPFKLPYVSWEKRGRLRVHRLNEVMAHV